MPFCVRADIELVLSAAGVVLGADDNDPEAVEYAVARADDEVLEHCLPRYAEAQLARTDKTWVKHHAAVIAAFYLKTRRGNPPPPGVALQFERTMKKLERVQAGTLNIPSLPLKKAGAVPVISNVRPTLRPHPRTVVERDRSTGEPEGYTQNRDPYDRAGLNDPGFTNNTV